MCGSIHVLEALSELPPQEIEEAFLSIEKACLYPRKVLKIFKSSFRILKEQGI